MPPILVTGATGTLGRALVRALEAQGYAVRALSRRPRPDDTEVSEWATGDLRTGAGLDAALTGVDTVVHAATANGRGDIETSRTLIEAARRAGVGHLLYVSIAGVDRVPLPYYRAKLEVERLVEDSGLPWTILRATQFHDLVAGITAAQRLSPVVLALAGVSFRPVDTHDVATELTRLVAAGPVGRVPDLGGPETHTSVELTRAVLRAAGRRRPVLPVRLPGKTFAGYRAGLHLAPDGASGRITFAQYLDERFAGKR
ncbi:SDR family oxidoreductase [Embleya sp. NBC_00896]|uniref:SDR family oxidoreductase n=1 Tax=Embleya sp. NBC_00896 TaxID=2975961 RepID=UPI003866BEF8|nr:NAD(P)H-binding protein [Embleya sp. NBC_00896]